MATRRNAKRSKKVVISKLEQLDELIRSNHWKMMVYEMATKYPSTSYMTNIKNEK